MEQKDLELEFEEEKRNLKIKFILITVFVSIVSLPVVKYIIICRGFMS